MEFDPIEQVHTHVWDARGIARLLNLLFKQSLTDESPKAPQPTDIRIPLRSHQRAMVAAMGQLEVSSLQGRPYGLYKTFSNYGFVGDEVGTGKSLVVLSHISNMKNATHLTENTELLANNCPHLYTTETRKVPQDGSTLLVVPHTLFRQWQQYTKDHTTLKCFAIKSRTNLNQDTFANNVRQSDFVLVSNTLYKDTIYLAGEQHITWKRLFVDEADSIHIVSTSQQANAGFTWFISASWANFILHGSVLRNHMLNCIEGPNALTGIDEELKVWLKNEIGSIVTAYGDRYTYMRLSSHSFFREFLNTSVFRGMQVLRCRQSFIDESMSMPPIHPVQILCEQPLQQQLVHQFVSSQVQAMLHGGDIQGALEHLGVKAEDSQTLLQAFVTQQTKELERLQKTLAFKESMEYASQQAKDAAIANLQTKIASVQQQMKTFKERIESISTELCPICYDEPKNTTLTPCCHRIFCGQCMLTCLVRTPACPMCRTPVQPSQLIHVKEGAKPKPEKKKATALLKKADALLDFIQKNPTARILVFSRYENPFAGLAMKCIEAGIQVDVLKGNKDCIANLIKDFESGQRRILFLPTQTAGAGMNLVGATHVVLYHAMTPEEERQVIGRAYRLGRKDPLTVVRLVHETEATNVVA